MRIVSLLFILIVLRSFAQENPQNGLKPSAPEYYLLKNAEIIVSPTKTLSKGSILIKGDQIVEVGNSVSKPTNTVEIDCEGKTIVPAFIELNSNFGIALPEKKNDQWYIPQLDTKKSNNYSWNEAFHPEFQAAMEFLAKDEDAKKIEAMGFGFVLTHSQDGIARGTGSLVSTHSAEKKQLILTKASAHFSFEKGSSNQTYPSSQMGSIALIRQSFYDLEWYEKQGSIIPNISLDALKDQLKKPLFFETKEGFEIHRAQKIADEFKLNFHYIGSGNEYEQLESLKKISGAIVVPLSFPKAFDVKDPYINKEIPLSALKDWDLAPSNPFLLASNGNTICLSAGTCKNNKEFWTNLKKAMSRGLSLEQALSALTLTPAKLLGADKIVGSLEKDKLASFFVYTSNPFTTDAEIAEQWILGQQTVLKPNTLPSIAGSYNLIIDGKTKPIEIEKKGESYSAKYEKAKTGSDKEVYVSLSENDITIQFNDSIDGFSGSINLKGKVHPKFGVMEGEGTLPSGKWIKWSAVKQNKAKSESKSNPVMVIDSSYKQKIWFPNMAYGRDTLPEQLTYVIKNVTAWTNEDVGVLKNATVIIEKGKITFIGDKGYRTPAGAIEIDGTGMHLTNGIIDEHSHIAISKGVNEAGQAIVSEVSIQDVVRNNDINIYRQLAGGVTTSQLLHGSADPIGGQSAIIKLKWGMTPEEMLLPNAPKFIKFALGENVKQANWGDFNTVRFPQTRMGVEQVYMDAFTRALEYKSAYQSSKQAKSKLDAPRRDLELDALVEILNKERFITCHSYIQSEINMLMHVADSFGFKINTFTHILEGYKVADKMAAHGAGASTFSDWWAYKYEVKDAIPYNAKIMADQGVVVAINSDDAEMGRRLNQEAAKAVKYGGMSEQDAWKMVTLNPAKLLHIDDRVGSIKVGKDADLVLWTTHPLSIEAIADKVFIDGTKFYDREEDAILRLEIQKERARIITKMLEAKQKGEETKSFTKETPKFYHCNTLGETGTSESNEH